MHEVELGVADTVAPGQDRVLCFEGDVAVWVDEEPTGGVVIANTVGHAA